MHGIKDMLASNLLSDISCGWTFRLNISLSCLLRVQSNRMALSTDRSDVAISATRRDDDFFNLIVAGFAGMPNR